MGRRARYDADQILDAAAGLVASGGPGAATVPAIAEVLGAPSGSIYHRFAARDLILAELWMRTVRRSQQGFLERLENPGVGTAVAAALHVVAWSREHLTDAQVLLLHRREELAARWPDELGDELGVLNDGITRALQCYSRWRFDSAAAPHMERVVFALVDVPYGAVHRHLAAGRPPPPSTDALVSSAVEHLLGPGC